MTMPQEILTEHTDKLFNTVYTTNIINARQTSFAAHAHRLSFKGLEKE